MDWGFLGGICSSSGDPRPKSQRHLRGGFPVPLERSRIRNPEELLEEVSEVLKERPSVRWPRGDPTEFPPGCKRSWVCLLLTFLLIPHGSIWNFFPRFFFFSPLQIPPPALRGRKCRISFQGGVSGSDFGVGFVLSTKRGEFGAGGGFPSKHQ